MRTNNTKLKGLASRYFAAFTALFFGLTGMIHAQTVNTYTFAQSAGTYTPIVGTNLIAANTDDAVSALAPIGFTFVYEGNSFTTFGVSSNGSMRLGAVPDGGTDPITFARYDYTPLSSAPNSNAISPLGRDGRTFSGVSYSVAGAVGSRVLTVQFADQNMNWTGTAGTGFARVSAQVKLYETTNVVQFVYTTPIATGTVRATQIGLRGALATNFANRVTSFAASTAGPLVTSTMGVGTGNVPAAGRT